MACKESTAEASLAVAFDLIRLGMAIAAIIRMIATTISNSISEKPFSVVFMFSAARLKLADSFAASFTLNAKRRCWRQAMALSQIGVISLEQARCGCLPVI